MDVDGDEGGVLSWWNILWKKWPMAWKRSWAPGGVGGGVGEALASPVPVGEPDVGAGEVAMALGGSTVLGGLASG